MKSISRIRLFATPWTVAHQAPPSMGFSRQGYWTGLPFPSPGDLPDPGIEPGSPTLQADALPSEPPGKPCDGEADGKAHWYLRGPPFLGEKARLREVRSLAQGHPAGNGKCHTLGRPEGGTCEATTWPCRVGIQASCCGYEPACTRGSRLPGAPTCAASPSHMGCSFYSKPVGHHLLPVEIIARPAVPL